MFNYLSLAYLAGHARDRDSRHLNDVNLSLAEIESIFATAVRSVRSDLADDTVERLAYELTYYLTNKVSALVGCFDQATVCSIVINQLKSNFPPEVILEGGIYNWDELWGPNGPGVSLDEEKYSQPEKHAVNLIAHKLGTWMNRLLDQIVIKENRRADEAIALHEEYVPPGPGSRLLRAIAVGVFPTPFSFGKDGLKDHKEITRLPNRERRFIDKAVRPVLERYMIGDIGGHLNPELRSIALQLALRRIISNIEAAQQVLDLHKYIEDISKACVDEVETAEWSI